MINRGTIGLKNIGLLEQHELAIRDFYAGIAEAIPEQSEFWTAMAKEEDGHAKLVAALLLEVKAGNAFFSSTAFNIPVLEKSTSTIRYQTKRLQENGIDAVQAIGRALAIERDILEENFYDIADGDTSTVISFKSAMHRSVVVHVAKLHEFYTNGLTLSAPPEAKDTAANVPQIPDIAPLPVIETDTTIPAPSTTEEADSTRPVDTVAAPPEAPTPGKTNSIALNTSTKDTSMNEQLTELYDKLGDWISERSSAIDEHAAEMDALTPVRQKLRTTLMHQGIIPVPAATAVANHEEAANTTGPRASTTALTAWEEINDLHEDIEVKLHEHRRSIDVHAAKIDAFTQVREELAKLLGLSV